MAEVRVYQPQLSVTLFKTIQRTMLDDKSPVSERFKATGTKGIDLAPYLCDTGGIRTSKSVRDPAGGFQITLADRPRSDGIGFDTLYGLIEPMDFIEIRVRHDPSMTLGSETPVLMRGFISEIQRSEAAIQDGRPSRTISISGQDYGKLWQMLQILFLPGYVVGQDTISSFKLFERFGLGYQTSQPISEFVKDVIGKVLNPYLKNLMPENTTNPSQIKTDKVVVSHGTTSLSGSQNQEGNIYNLLRTYGDVGIWNELFMEDRDDGVYCVFRPNPFKSLDGKKIQTDAPDVDVTDVYGEDLIAINVSRSDAGVANYYWVNGARFELATDVNRKLYAIQDKKTVLLTEYPNSASNLYGIRVMFVDSQLGGDEVKEGGSGQDKATQDKRNTTIANWLGDRRRILVEQNRDNVVFEHGTMRLRGNEKIRAGTYIRLTRGQFSAEYYVTQVSHDFIPFQGFFTTVGVERGTGFVERAKAGAVASPYFAEMMSRI